MLLHSLLSKNFWLGIFTKTNFSLRWWPGEAGDHPIVAKDDLGDLGGLGGEDAERVVPEPASQDESWVQSDHEAVRLHADPLAEIVTQVTPNLKRVTNIDNTGLLTVNAF